MLSKSICRLVSNTKLTLRPVACLTKFNSNLCRNISSTFHHPDHHTKYVLLNKTYLKSFSTSAQYSFNKTNNDKPSIIQPVSPSTASSVEIKKIINDQIGVDEDAATQLKNNKQKESQEEERKNSNEAKSGGGGGGGGGGGMFSKENAWKYSLGFFTVWFSALGVYVLIEWGKPRVEETTKMPVMYCIF